LQAEAAGRALAIISGREHAVSLRNVKGRGGRSQEWALALSRALDRAPGMSALAADTDGIDGGEGKPTDAAGATIDATTLAGVRHLDAKNLLHNNDATSFFEAAGGLIVRGPTHTNVNDFRVILVDA
jgi:glycerate 2-kinase